MGQSWYEWYNIQLTNGILWNSRFYYRNLIRITITQAKGEGNANFYHIEVMHNVDLPFNRIPFVLADLYHSSTIWKNKILLKSNKQNCDNLCASKFTGQSIFRYSSFDVQQCAQPRTVRTYNDRRLCLTLFSPGYFGGWVAGGGAAPAPPSDLGRGSRDHHKNLHKGRMRCKLQDCIVRLFCIIFYFIWIMLIYAKNLICTVNH